MEVQVAVLGSPSLTVLMVSLWSYSNTEPDRYEAGTVFNHTAEAAHVSAPLVRRQELRYATGELLHLPKDLTGCCQTFPSLPFSRENFKAAPGASKSKGTFKVRERVPVFADRRAN